MDRCCFSTVNAFRGAGIYTSYAMGSKVSPSDVYQQPHPNPGEKCPTSTSSQKGVTSALSVLESEMDKDTLLKYNRRLEEGYDLEEDPLYNVWSKIEESKCFYSKYEHRHRKSHP